MPERAVGQAVEPPAGRGSGGVVGKPRQVAQVGSRAVDLRADLGEEHPESLGVREVRGLNVAAHAERRASGASA